jgi:hypothetical protein
MPKPTKDVPSQKRKLQKLSVEKCFSKALVLTNPSSIIWVYLKTCLIIPILPRKTGESSFSYHFLLKTWNSATING